LKISIITVVLNGEGTIRSTLESVSNQIHKNFEHIVIDGGSTDATLPIISSYKGHKINLITGPDSGIYDAMNKGLAISGGDILGFVNADDTYSDFHVLKNIVDVFKDKTIDACYGDLVYVDSNNKTVLRYWRSKNYKSGDFYRGWAPPHPTFYIRRSVLNKIGFFDKEFGLAADFEFMLRCLEVHSLKAAYIPKVLVRMRIGGATSRSFLGVIKQNIKIVNACMKHNSKFNLVVFLILKLISKLGEIRLAILYN